MTAGASTSHPATDVAPPPSAESAAPPGDQPPPGATEGSGGRGPRPRRSAGWIAGALVVAGLIAAAVLLPVDRGLLALVEWIRDAGTAGVTVYAIAYVLATVLLLPGSVLTLGAGFAYGPLWGTILVSPVSTLAATVAFLLGRTVLRGWIARKVEGNPRFAAVDQAVGEEGFKIVLLLRLSPVFPFNVLNYVLGLTRVRLRDYLLASWIGMLPGTFLYVYLGSLVTNAAELLSGERPDAGPLGQALFFGGLAATLAVTVLVTRIARRALKRALDPVEELRT